MCSSTLPLTSQWPKETTPDFPAGKDHGEMTRCPEGEKQYSRTPKITTGETGWWKGNGRRRACSGCRPPLHPDGARCGDRAHLWTSWHPSKLSLPEAFSLGCQIQLRTLHSPGRSNLITAVSRKKAASGPGLKEPSGTKGLCCC